MFVALMGSGETGVIGGKVFDAVAARYGLSPNISVLETPAGFEPNSAWVAGRVAEFVARRLQNYQPRVQVLPVRQREAPFSTDDAQLTAPLLNTDVIFMGPGSPTYAVRHLHDSLAWHRAVARHRLGASLVLASAASIAVGALALPVYEIYKAGHALHWVRGLDFFAPYGLSLVIVPHWNNREGGKHLDTGRCFMGQERFSRLLEMLPTNVTVVGIDEQTALLVDLKEGTAKVMGQGTVTAIRKEAETLLKAKEEVPLVHFGPFRQPAIDEGLPPAVWREALAAHESPKPPEPQPPQEVLALSEARGEARRMGDWRLADRLRAEILALGWASARFT